METLLEITSIILLAICIFESLQIRCLSSLLDDAIKGIQHLEAEQTRIKAKQRLFEQRFMRMSEPADKVIISHEYHSKDAPDFGQNW